MMIFDGIEICSSEDIKNYFSSNAFFVKKGFKGRADNFIKILIKKVKDNADDLTHNVWLKYREEYLSLEKDDPRRKEIL